MKLNEMLKGLSYDLLNGDTGVEISDITIDSREVTTGCLFVCVKGVNVDRHEFICSAAERGAVAVLVEKDISGYPDGLNVVKVDNARIALTKIAAEFYGNPDRGMKIVGVTGTNGKTSVTNFIAQLLAAHGKKVGLIGTLGVKADGIDVDIKFNTPTSPDTIELYKILSRMKVLGIEYVVMEVSSHALALYKLDGISFEVGVFTNLTQDHLDFHETMDNYLKAKAKLFKLCRHGVINADDGAFQYIINNSECGVMTYSIEKESDLKAKDITYSGAGTDFRLEETEMHIPVQGKFMLYNTLAAVGAVLLLGMVMSEVKTYLKNLKGIPGRFERIEFNTGFNVYIDYAHTPDGLSNILKAVREITKNKVIIVFGCGGDRDKTKRPLMGKIAGELADYCIVTSDNPRSEDPLAIIDEASEGLLGREYERITDRKEAIYRAVTLAAEGDSVIIAGKGHEDYQELSGGKIHFDDKETALQALSGIILF